MIASKEDVELRGAAHLPHRSWRLRCVRGRARRRNHRKEAGGESLTERQSFQWMARGMRAKSQRRRRHSAREPNVGHAVSGNQMRAWSRVPLKKGVGSYSVGGGGDMLLFAGHEKVILESDGDAPTTALTNATEASSDLGNGRRGEPSLRFRG